MRKPNKLRMSETVQEIMHIILKQALGFRCLSCITPALAKQGCFDPKRMGQINKSTRLRAL